MTEAGAFPVPDSWLEHRVSYGETDAMGVMYYAEYLHLFERGRGQYMRDKDMSYPEVEAGGIILPVREAHCRYRSPMRYNDLVFIRTGISEWGRASIRFIYEIKSHDKTRLLATGMTQHACADSQGKPVAVPDWLRQMLS